jgi:hypothetical protein
VARPGGSEVVHKTIQTWLRAGNDQAVLALDSVNAFLAQRRAILLQEVDKRCEPLSVTARQWYDRRAKHL